MTDIPPDFQLLGNMDPVLDALAPIYVRQEASGGVTMGFCVGPQHCNPNGDCHGGTWATLADVLMGLNVGLLTGLGGPTISLNLDFLGAARVGHWAEGSARVLRSTRNLGFVECLFTVDGEPTLRANAVFRRRGQPFGQKSLPF